jgi:hypothetical protein
MKKLGICGDSFFASISFNPKNLDNGHDKHFTEILAKKLGWEVITFARGACSNQTIRLQIDEVIKHKPDLVIVGTTTPDRFEYPINHISIENYRDKIYDKFRELGYKEQNGLSNIDYLNYPDKSGEHEIFKTNKSFLFSETLNNIFFNNQPTNYLKNYDIEVLEKWYDRFYDFQWKTQTDTWIISDGLRKLKEKNIDFFCVSSFLFENQLSFSDNKIINVNSPLNPNNYSTHNSSSPYRFHTTLEDQKLLAELWFNYLNEYYGK